MCCDCILNRRDFNGLAAAGLAGGIMDRPSALASDPGPVRPSQWDPHLPLVVPGAALVVQPVLMYVVQEHKDETSYRSWGSVHTVPRGRAEIGTNPGGAESTVGRGGVPAYASCPWSASAPWSKPAPCTRVRMTSFWSTPPAALRSSLTACFATQPRRDTLIFVRHRNGPLYYWYEGLGMRVVKAPTPQEVARYSADNHGPVTVHDVVIDDQDELIGKLRALKGLKNFIGQRIVALGGPMGKFDPEAPRWRVSVTGSRSSMSVTTNSPAGWPVPGPIAPGRPGGGMDRHLPLASWHDAGNRPTIRGQRIPAIRAVQGVHG